MTISIPEIGEGFLDTERKYRRRFPTMEAFCLFVLFFVKWDDERNKAEYMRKRRKIFLRKKSEYFYAHSNKYERGIIHYTYPDSCDENEPEQISFFFPFLYETKRGACPEIEKKPHKKIWPESREKHQSKSYVYPDHFFPFLLVYTWR